MGRPAQTQSVSLWANGVRVGRWSLFARDQMELHYDDAWVASPLGRPLSLSLPFTLNNRPWTGSRVYNYFDNLLPDSDSIRKRVAEWGQDDYSLNVANLPMARPEPPFPQATPQGRARKDVATLDLFADGGEGL